MTINAPRIRRLTITALTVVTGAGAALTTAAPTAAAAATARMHRAGHPVFLVTGEQVLTGTAGVSVLGSPNGSAGQLVKLSMGGQTYVMPVTAAPYLGHGPAPITRAVLSVSFDGGKTWQAARMTGTNGAYAAVFRAPAGAMMTLRATAADGAGGTITQTISDAYRTRT